MSGRVLRASRSVGIGRFRLAFFGGHRIVFHDLAFEDPDLHAAGAISRLGSRHSVIYVGAQCVEWNPSFAIPLHPGNFCTAESATAIDADALRTEAHGGLHGPLHYPPEGHAALQLLGDV